MKPLAKRPPAMPNVVAGICDIGVPGATCGVPLMTPPVAISLALGPSAIVAPVLVLVPGAAGSANGPVSVGVERRTELPEGVRIVATTFMPVLVPKRFAVPTASCALADDGLTTVVAPGGDTAFPEHPAIATSATAGTTRLRNFITSFTMLDRTYKPSW